MSRPRLVPLAEARAYIGGRHPQFLGISPVLRGLYDLRAIDAALDQRSGLASLSSGPALQHQAANDEEDELASLEKRIAAYAARRT